MNKGLLALLGVAVIGGGAVLFWQGSSRDDLATPTVNTLMHGMDAAAPAKPADQIVVPSLTASGIAGQIAFEKNCAACHGKNAAGSKAGPPLVHKIYEPSHHADFAFVRAARQGVRAHHWRFGDMPPVAGVTDKQLEWIVTYVRQLQRANGIK